MKPIPPMPTTLEECEAQRVHLSARKAEIELQLSSKNATDEDGNRIPAHEYHEWRHRAIGALTILNKRLGAIRVRKREILKERYAAAGGVQSADPMAHLAAAYALLRKLARDGLDFDEQEQAIVDGIRMFLDTGSTEVKP